MPLFIDVFKRLGVVALVRVCFEDDYDTQPIQEAGVKCFVSFPLNHNWARAPATLGRSLAAL